MGEFLATSVHETEALLFAVLRALVVIIAAARLGGWLFGRLGQPQVVGEIAAGLLLGPSVFGRFVPEFAAIVFTPETSEVTRILGQLGLVFLMFLIGLEFEFGHLRHCGRTAAAVAVAGIVAPFALGLALALGMHPHVAPDVNPLGFSLFVATALSITAIPILGRIMLEFGMTRTQLGVLTISAAAIDDALGWIVLAVVSAIVSGGFQLTPVLAMLAMTLAYILLCLFVARPLMIRFAAHALRVGNGQLTLTHLSILLIVIFASAIATNLIGIFAIFGPFVLGACLWDQHDFRDAVLAGLRDFVNAFFLPVFFTYTGLHTDVGLLNTAELWLFAALICAAAILGKIGGCGLAARLGGLSWRHSSLVAVMMNTRALMGLIVITVGGEMGVIPHSVFGMLIIMAVLTTFMTVPIMRRLLRPEDQQTAAAP